MDVNVVNLFTIHSTDETKDKFQLFHSHDGRILQSMVLDKEEVRELHKKLGQVLHEQHDKEEEEEEELKQ